MPSRVFGLFISSLGILIMALSGICTIGFGFTFISEQLSRPTMDPGQLSILLIGVIPFGLGFLIFKWGQAIVKKHPRIPPGGPDGI